MKIDEMSARRRRRTTGDSTDEVRTGKLYWLFESLNRRSGGLVVCIDEHYPRGALSATWRPWSRNRRAEGQAVSIHELEAMQS